MSLKPILFSGPMVRAILTGSKTQTRRIPRKQVQLFRASDLKYHPNDILWVRETMEIKGKKRPAIHMPFQDCRLFLRVKTTAFKPLRDFSEEDAVAEGVQSVSAFITLWDSLNAKRGWEWSRNPIVEVVTFEVIDKATALALTGKEKPCA